ncbi:GNAT family N-acetyltransferase [Corallibacter sp.]|uniref:GNAT family N-acetyltransferase n=1 Tax=Corallibacter sp. TaxID=2038084 RepID=UPI003A94823B
MEITLKHTDASHSDFITLVSHLDADLKIRDGDDHEFYNQFNGIEALKHCIVAYHGNHAVGCGAIKPLNDTSMEVKRMFVFPEQRGKGIATTILKALEQWTKTLGYTSCKLETGIKQPEAIALYKRNSYNIISNYGQYAGVENSVCFEKKIL